MIEKTEVRQSGIFDYEIYPRPAFDISSCKGLNKKGLLVAMAGEERSELNDFLAKILQAVGFEMENDTLSFWVTSTGRFWFKELDQASPVQHAIFFGVAPQQAGLNLQVQLYKPLVINDKTFLFADNLAKIQENPPLKRPLWEALKIMFK